jgi:hypothetical protein
MGDRWAFLTFSRNDGDRVIGNIERLRAAVDEVVVIDSSDPEPARRLATEVEDRGGRVVRVLPLGNVDLLRPFGVAQVRSERTIYLDADERPSQGLVEGIPTLDRADAYVLPRRERSLGATSQHLRIFRNAAIRYRGPSFLFPEVAGNVAPAPEGVYLDHDAIYDRYFEARRERYGAILTTEWVERPFDRSYVWNALRPRSMARPRGSSEADSPRAGGGVLSVPAIVLGSELIGVRETVEGRSVRWGRFLRDYERRKASEWARLPDEEKARWRVIAHEVRIAGGLREYLGLDDPAYVEQLTRGFGWDRGGPEVLRELVDHRHRRGERRPAGPWEPATAAPPEPAASPEGSRVGRT